MGDRYYLTVTCPRCGRVDEDVYFAPTCEFTEHRCQCGEIIDLVKLTGITYEDASNADALRAMCDKAIQAVAQGEDVNADDLLNEIDD